MAAIDKVISRLANDAKDETDEARLARIVETLRAAEEARKHAFEADNLRRVARSENARFYVSVLAPLVSAIVLAATLIFQIWQFQEQRQEEGAQADAQLWRSFDFLSERDSLRASLKASQLQFLYENPRYREKARHLAVTLMRMVISAELADSVFRPLLRDSKWNEFDQIVAINRSLLEKRDYVEDEMEFIKGDTQTRSSETSLPEAFTTGARVPRSQLEVQRELDGFYDQLSFIGNQMAEFLRGEIDGPRPASHALDLSDTAWFDVNLTGADLRAAKLDRALISGSDLRDADLSQVASFKPSWWSATQWWNARAVSPELLGYLETEYPCRGQEDCSEYESHLRRLRGEMPPIGATPPPGTT